MPHDVFGEDPSNQIAQIGNLYGTHAARPAAGGVLDGIFYVETDTSSVFQTQGGAWVLIDTLTTADVISVFTRTGAVTATSGDYSVAQVTGAAPLVSPTLSGTPAAPTATVDTNTTQISTTAFVLGQASAVGDSTPAMDGSAARGASTHYARANHVHPTDTSRAPAYVATGTTTLVGGTIDVANVSITANSIVLVYSISSGGTVGALSVVLTAGVSFTINSTSATDTSKVYYQIVSF